MAQRSGHHTAALLKRYASALAAHRRAVRALVDASMPDASPDCQLVGNERKAQARLSAARKELLQALAMT
jgi:hypothetical protein